MAVEAEVGFYERTYTLKQLQMLRDCYDLNKDSSEPLTATLEVFVGSGYGDLNNDDVLFWLRFLEQIKNDRDFPEKAFSQKTDQTFSIVKPIA